MNSSSSETDYGYNINLTPKKKKVEKCHHRKQKFRMQWKNLFNWLISVPSDQYKAKCKLCSTIMTAELSIFRRHEKTQSHILKLKPSNQKSVVQYMLSSDMENKADPLKCQVKRAEIKLCGFLAEHNLSFLINDHLSDLLKKCFTDSRIAQEINLKRTKATAITKNVIGKSHKQSLVRILKKNTFSILVDESTDISTVKTACLLVRFYDANLGQIRSYLLELIQIFDSKKDKPDAATAEHLFQCIRDVLVNNNISFTNIIGFASDGCNTMMGHNNSVASRLKDMCPNITIMKCICHSLHLCASEACKTLPRRAEDLSRNIYNFFKNSSKRQAIFAKFQIFLHLDIHKMLHPAQTRWLSFAPVVRRVLENWEALILFFNDMWLLERLVAAEEIYKSLNDPYIKLIYLFLDWCLPKFHKMNAYFQSEKVVITELYNKMSSAFQEMLLCYMKRDYILKTNLSDINPNNKTKYLSDTELYLGVAVYNELNNPKNLGRRDYEHLKTNFFERCKEFLSTGCKQIQLRFDFNDKILSEISILKPSTALSHKTREAFPSLVFIAEKLPRLLDRADYQDLDDEWRKLPLYKFEENIAHLEVDKFYHYLSKITDDDNIPEFDTLSKFALNVVSLPHSNADCERIFSKVNLIKTKQRNKIITPTLNGLLLANQIVSMEGCVNFEPNADMMDKMNNSMYDEVDEDIHELLGL